MDSAKNICQEDIRRILVVKPSSLGDIIHVFPALVNLTKIFPDAEIDFLVNTQFAGLLDYSPVKIRKKVIFERKKLGTLRGFIPESIKLIKNLRREKYDLVIDFQGLFRSAIFSYFAKARFGVCGYENAREKSATVFYRYKESCSSIHAVERNAELLNRLFSVQYPVSECDIPAVASRAILPEGTPECYTIVLPGARWESKRFPISFFAQIILPLLEAGQKIVLAGSLDEEALCQKIIEACKNHQDIFCCAGKTDMSQLFELIRYSDAVVCNDSGPLHIASIMNKRIFCFFGSTVPDKTGPWNSRAKVYRKDIDCSGCLKRICPKKDIPCHGIDPQEVVNDILNREI